MILTTPLLERLAREGEVHVVATPANAAVLTNHPAVASVIVYDKRNADAGVAGLRRVAAQLRNTRATTAYIAQGSWRSAALARSSASAIRAARWCCSCRSRWTGTARARSGALGGELGYEPVDEVLGAAGLDVDAAWPGEVHDEPLSTKHC